MTQQGSTPAEIAPAGAVEPTGTSQPAPASLPDSDETAKLRAELAAQDEQIKKLKSIKDSETATERRARLEAEAERERLTRELADEREAHWRNFNKYAPEDEVARARQAYEAEAAQRNMQEVSRAKWEVFKWEKASEVGANAEEIKAIRNNNQLSELLQRKREEKLLKDKKDELLDEVMAKLKQEGLIQPATPAPKTPVDIGAKPAAPPAKLSKDDVDALERAWTRDSRNRKKKEAYLKAVEEYTGNPAPAE